MASNSEDERWMRRALRLASAGYTAPNPMVGCVLVRDGVEVGRGFHRYAGAGHAEVAALKQAGNAAAGATAYVTLEPCCHWGRTPPCTQALIQAGVKRVIAAITDPNPQVAGRGMVELKEAGIEVESGLLASESRKLNESYFYFQEHHLPFITLKAGVSLDGKMATRSGHSQWITGEQARRHAHRLRAKQCAIVTGIGTVLQDDPLLTARVAGAMNQPVRVVVDSCLRIPPTARVLHPPKMLERARKGEPFPATVIATTDAAPDERCRELERLGARVVKFPADGGEHVDLLAMVKWLGAEGMTSVLIEAGGRLGGAFLEANRVNKVVVYVAPILIGGSGAPSFWEGEGSDRLLDAPRLQDVVGRWVGGDFMIEGYLPAAGGLVQADARIA
ncbi:MAG: bifunctional diaminohydroxyphosphoribosylaminopyrimidine deaminase/5-amino-6-(5-phosphoribosylamino)uracil reductase RibD [Armatimonadetes bacterium]|nr:bifunctional diaminohydroxyphosphoribosylaminopyrimidine deaminase/5-amino-6-(5-phosphoribosylamino)uracil reductase RibD [Armatimonadota bacterium]